MPIKHLSFLTPGNYPDSDPLQGLDASLDLFAFGESLGFDGAWVRHRHLERGVSSAAAFLAAATQRTRHIELGAAVISMGYENPFRLAEDLATVDVLSRGRLQVGLSAGPPAYAALLGTHFLDAGAEAADTSHARINRLRENIRSPLLGDGTVLIPSPAGAQWPRVHPIAAGLPERLWYGGGSNYSIGWAAANGYNLLIGNVTKAETSDRFLDIQSHHLDRYEAAWREDRSPRIALGRVIVPLDGADPATRVRYRAYAEARHARTLSPQGPRRTVFGPDIVGMADEILEQLRKDPILPRVEELRLELPYDFSIEDYRQILSDTASLIAPALGWRGTLSRAA